MRAVCLQLWHPPGFHHFRWCAGPGAGPNDDGISRQPAHSSKPYLLVGLAGVELEELQKFAIPYLLATSVLMTLAAVAFGVIRF